MNIGLFFGSFNPIHVGHLILANYMVDRQPIDQVWFVVSPQNPLKEKESLLADYHRLNLVKIAIDDNPRFRACDIEFKLSKPSYTSHTLAHLIEAYPGNTFSLLLGEDNLRTFDKWYNYESILKNHQLYVYPRIEDKSESISKRIDFNDHPGIHLCKDAPLMKISASYIRNAIQHSQSIQYLLPPKVEEYVQEMNFYRW